MSKRINRSPKILLFAFSMMCGLWFAACGSASGTDGGTDAGADAGVRDAGTDAGADAGR